MTISKETIEKFKQIYKRKSGKELSDQEALDMVTNLLLVFEAVYRPIPKDKEKEFRKICREQKKYEASIKTKDRKTPKDI